MKHVLIITYYWPPSGGNGVQRWVKFVKYLRNFGWEPIVYAPLNAEYPVVDESLSVDVPENISVLKNKIREPYNIYKNFTGKKSNEKINRDVLGIDRKLGFKEKIALWVRANYFIPDARMWWIKPSVKYLKDYLKNNNVDAIITSGPPHSLHLIANELKEATGLPWIADFRDPWTTMDYFDDLPLSFWAKNKHFSLEKNVLENADHIVCVGEQMKLEFSAKTNKPVSVITNGYDTEDLIEDSNTNTTDFFTLLHLGSFLQRRNPIVLWKALKEILNESDEFRKKLKIKLIGRVESTITNSLKEYELTQFIETVSYVSHDKVFEQLNSSSVLLLPIDRFDGAKWVLTGKIFEYIVAHRYIICIGPPDGDAAFIINQTKTGMVIDFDDIENCKKIILERFNQFESGNTFREGENLDLYSRKNLTGKLSEILDKISA